MAKSDKYKDFKWGVVPLALWLTPLNDLHKKIIAIVLAYAGGPDWSCYPSQVTVARLADCSRRTVITALKLAEAYGILTIVKQYRKTGRRGNNKYVFCPVSTWQLSEAARSLSPCEAAPARSEGGLSEAARSHGSRVHQVQKESSFAHEQVEQTISGGEARRNGKPKTGKADSAEVEETAVRCGAGEEGETRRTKTSSSSNNNCSGSTKGNRRRDTESEGGAPKKTRGNARSKVSARTSAEHRVANDEDREPALSSRTRTTSALCDLLLEDA